MAEETDRIKRLEEQHESLQRLASEMFLTLASIHRLLVQKGVLTQAEYLAQHKVVEDRHQEALRKEKDQDLARALHRLLSDYDGPLQ